MSQIRRLIGLSILLILAACGGNQPSAPGATNLSAGEALYNQNGCLACHALEDGPNAPTAGPVIEGLMARAAETITAEDYTGSATTAEEYVREAIIQPEVYIVPDYLAIMPATYEASLTEDELDTLVEYLKTFN